MASRNTAKDKRHFEQTIKEARIGHRESQYQVGLMYANGVGVVQDLTQAISWVKQAAERGFAPAQYLLATRFSAGEVVEQDDHQALKWYLKAADQDHPKALYKLAQFYSTTHERAASNLVQAAAIAGVPQAQFDIATEMLAQSEGEVSAERGFVLCKQAAEQGVAAAQCALAEKFAHGYGVPQDVNEAYAWYRKAARQFHISAHVAMIQLDETGQGRGSGGRSRYSSGSTDRRRDAEQWNQAGDAGDATAKYQLGLMYQNGWGVPQDQAQRQRWFQAAAQLGHPQAQLALADMLEAALDYQQALGWYQQAAAAKQAVACACLGRFYGLGLGTPKDDFLDLFWTITAADLGQTDALARLALFAVAEPDRLLMACLKKAAAAGIADAQYALGKHFETVNRPEFDIQAAIRNYQSAAQQGHALAQFCLGLIYSEGKGVRKDMTLAQNWFTLAANQNDAKAQWNLSLLLISGTDGLKKDLKKAFLLCEKAAIQGFVPAQASLGILYAKMKKPQKAAEWWQLAAEQGDPEAQFNLSLAYSNGLGVAKDAASAINWLIKAAEQGVVTAQSKLGLLYATGSGVALDSIEAHKWFLIASEKGDKAAQANLQHSESQIGKMQKAEAIRRCRAWTPFVH